MRSTSSWARSGTERREGYVSARRSCRTTPFTDTGLALLKGTKDFLVAQNGLAAKDFSIDDWIVAGGRKMRPG